MTRATTCLLAAWSGFFLLLGAVPPAAAQTGAEVRAAIAETQTVLDAAAKVVAERGCARGEALLERAAELQESARSSVSIGGGGLRGALQRTIQARRLAQEAMRTCQVEGQAVEQVRKLLESTRELAQQARGRMGSRPSVDAERLLAAGLEQLEQAEAAYREEQLQLAVSYLNLARKLIERALASIPATDVAADPRQVEDEIARTESVLAEFRGENLGPRRQVLFDQAVANQDRARAALSGGRLVQALEFTQASRRLADELLREGPEGSEGIRVRRAIDVVGRSFSGIEGEIRDSGDAAAIELLERASESLALARDELAEERFGAAARAARLAASLLRRAAESAGVR